MNYELGQRVRFTHALIRVWDDGKKLWEDIPRAAADEGIVMGKRTLSNGENEKLTEFDGYGSFILVGTEYRATEHFTAYLIAFDLRRKPVLVRPEHMEVLLP